METKPERVRRPFWVKLGLLFVGSRGAALGYFWLCVVLGVAFLCVSIGLAVTDSDSGYWVGFIICGIAVLPAGLWYGLAIRWMDRHNRWP